MTKKKRAQEQYGKRLVALVENIFFSFDPGVFPRPSMDEVAQKIENYAKSKRRNCHQTATEPT